MFLEILHYTSMWLLCWVSWIQKRGHEKQIITEKKKRLGWTFHHLGMSDTRFSSHTAALELQGVMGKERVGSRYSMELSRAVDAPSEQHERVCVWLGGCVGGWFSRLHSQWELCEDAVHLSVTGLWTNAQLACELLTQCKSMTLYWLH